MASEPLGGLSYQLFRQRSVCVGERHRIYKNDALDTFALIVLPSKQHTLFLRYRSSNAYIIITITGVVDLFPVTGVANDQSSCNFPTVLTKLSPTSLFNVLLMASSEIEIWNKI